MPTFSVLGKKYNPDQLALSMHTLYKKSVQVNKKRRTGRRGRRVGQGEWGMELSSVVGKVYVA